MAYSVCTTQLHIARGSNVRGDDEMLEEGGKQYLNNQSNITRCVCVVNFRDTRVQHTESQHTWPWFDDTQSR